MLLNILQHYLTLVNIRKRASQHRSKLLTVVFNDSINVICAREMLCVCVYVFLLRKNEAISLGRGVLLVYFET